MLMAGREDLAVKAYGAPLVASVPRPTSFVELAAAALRAEGRETGGMSRTEIIAEGFSTMSMPSALGLGVEKLALQVFLDESKNWSAIGRPVPVTSFRQGKAIRLAAGSRLEAVGRDGELKHGVIGEDSFNIQASTYGRVFTLTRQSIIDDDAGILMDIPVLLGSESARTVSDVFFQVLTGNANGYFSAGHGNQVSGALTYTTLGSAITIMRTRVDADNRVIGLRPMTLAVPAAQEENARQLLNSTTLWRTSDLAPTANPLAGLNLTLVVEPRMDSVSPNACYLFGEIRHAALLVAFLDGQQGVRVESQQSEFSTLGLSWRAYMDMGVSQGEWRAAVQIVGS
jgi:hypothetical protein